MPFKARDHGIDRYLPKEDAPSPKEHAAETPQTRARAPKPSRPRRIAPAAKPQTVSTARRVITVHITNYEDDLLDRERRKRIKMGQARSDASFATLVREAIAQAYGPPQHDTP